MPKLKWGIICSVTDDSLLMDLKEFGKWLIQNIMEYGSTRLSICRDFEAEPEFIFHSKPGDVSLVKIIYENINQKFPSAIYILHILPEKGSKEYGLMRSHTLKYALIGQGILLENALSRFANMGSLENVMDQINQWISRRMSDLISRHKDNNFSLYVHGNNITQAILDNSQDYFSSVEAILHSTYEVKETSMLENIIIVEGFPVSFNKFQIASLFPDFRPKNVLRATGDQAIVEFTNRFHAAQITQIYKYGVQFSDSGGFTLKARDISFGIYWQDIQNAIKGKLLFALKSQEAKKHEEIS